MSSKLSYEWSVGNFFPYYGGNQFYPIRNDLFLALIVLSDSWQVDVVRFSKTGTAVIASYQFMAADYSLTHAPATGGRWPTFNTSNNGEIVMLARSLREPPVPGADAYWNYAWSFTIDDAGQFQGVRGGLFTLPGYQYLAIRAEPFGIGINMQANNWEQAVHDKLAYVVVNRVTYGSLANALVYKLDLSGPTPAVISSIAFPLSEPFSVWRLGCLALIPGVGLFGLAERDDFNDVYQVYTGTKYFFADEDLSSIVEDDINAGTRFFNTEAVIPGGSGYYGEFPVQLLGAVEGLLIWVVPTWVSADLVPGGIVLTDTALSPVLSQRWDSALGGVYLGYAAPIQVTSDGSTYLVAGSPGSIGFTGDNFTYIAYRISSTTILSPVSVYLPIDMGGIPVACLFVPANPIGNGMYMIGGIEAGFSSFNYDVSFFGIPIAPTLRMVQRDDGLGSSPHPRLRAANGPTSIQLRAAPRIGGVNTYL